MQTVPTFANSTSLHRHLRLRTGRGTVQRFLIAGLATLVSSMLATGRTMAVNCMVRTASSIPCPGSNNIENQFGSTVAISGDWAIVGAYGNSSIMSFGGAAFVMHRTNSEWSIVQTLGSGVVTTGCRFGVAVAMEHGVAVVGARRQLVNGVAAGAAHVYRLNDSTWSLEQMLIAADPNDSDDFGTTASISGETIVIGAPRDDQAGTDSGAAYVFRRIGGAWVQEQKLVDPAPLAQDRFGQSVAIDGSRIVAGKKEAALLFEYNGSQWPHVVTFASPDSTGNDRFGSAVAIKGTTVAIGAPFHDVRRSWGAGSVYIYGQHKGVWQVMQTLIASDIFAGDHQFGSAVAIDGDWLVAGARGMPDFIEGSSVDRAGAIYVFKRFNGVWTEQYSGRAKPRYAPDFQTDYNEDDELGASAAMSGGAIIAGGPGAQFAGDPEQVYGKVVFFDYRPTDCDANGMPDGCEPDCNHNRTNDVCDVTSGSSADCNLNSLPDECDTLPDYQKHSGAASVVWGALTAHDMMWVNHFTVRPGGQRLTHIGVSWSAFGPDHFPGTAVVYSDPNNNGHPADAVLLATAPVELNDALGTGGQLGQQIYQLPTTYIGEPGAGFFIGVVMTLPAQTYPALIDWGASDPYNWRISGATGVADISDLSVNWTINQANGDWLVTAFGLDCNGNGVFDECDIQSGASSDQNDNGIPDECDLPCPADATHSGSVNIDDLVVVITNWGALGSNPADVNNDNIVNIDDLVLVVTNWGACP